jgi:hypothetical protein
MMPSSRSLVAILALSSAALHAGATQNLDPFPSKGGLSSDASLAEARIVAQADNRGLPYAVVDKKAARIYVHFGDGRLAGSSAILTGLARGDGSVPGIGDRPVNQIRPFERTTPAGRFESEPGRTLTGEDNVWIDYDTAIAIHRLRPGASQARRLAALASPDPSDNRQSYGCVVVPPKFFDEVVKPLLGRSRGVVYVLPDDAPADRLFHDQPVREAATSRVIG